MQIEKLANIEYAQAVATFKVTFAHRAGKATK